jgi:hypothetical protein
MTLWIVSDLCPNALTLTRDFRQWRICGNERWHKYAGGMACANGQQPQLEACHHPSAIVGWPLFLPTIGTCRTTTTGSSVGGT